MTDDGLSSFCHTQYPKLVGMLGLICGDRAVAEELAQETLARVWRRWPKVHSLDVPEAWARRVALNLATSHLRRRAAERRALRRVSPDDTTIEDRMPPDIEALRLAVTSLPKRQRSAIVLHYLVDLSLEEVADHMNASVPAVKSILHRALRKLRSQDNVKELLEVVDVT